MAINLDEQFALESETTITTTHPVLTKRQLLQAALPILEDILFSQKYKNSKLELWDYIHQLLKEK